LDDGDWLAFNSAWPERIIFDGQAQNDWGKACEVQYGYAARGLGHW
jgi:hypothetical protein